MVLKKTPVEYKEITPVNLKEISPEYSLERLLIKLKSPDEKSQFIGTDLVAGKD